MTNSDKKTVNKKSSSSKDNNDNDVIVFEQKETELLEETAKDLNIDIQNDSDLLENLNQMTENAEDLTPDQLDKVLEDKSVKTLIRDIGNTPTIMDTLPPNTKVAELTLEEINQRKQDKVDRRNNLILMLADNDTIKLHLGAGMKEGKKIWIEKEFYFNSYDKKDEFRLSILSARLRGMATKHTLLVNKDMSELSPGEQNFLMNSQLMIEVAAYRLQEQETHLKFGMTPYEYARVETKELDIARAAFEEHTKNVPSYRPGQRFSGSKAKTGSILDKMTLV